MMSINSSLTKQHLFKQMTKETAIGMLNVANTGNDLIAILDVISNDMDVNNANDVASVGVTDFNDNAVEF